MSTMDQREIGTETEDCFITPTAKVPATIFKAEIDLSNVPS